MTGSGDVAGEEATTSSFTREEEVDYPNIEPVSARISTTIIIRIISITLCSLRYDIIIV